MCSVWDIEISTFARLTKSKDGVENRHTDDGNRESENAFPTDHLDWLNGMFCHDEFFEDEL